MITVDGPPICRICVLTWGGLAAAIHAGRTPVEPGRAELAHREHLTRVPGCRWCMSVGGYLVADA
ncbi:MAG TPA: hypothetical protein VIF84_03950 [Candidatus Limnocylindrales bacterium]